MFTRVETIFKGKICGGFIKYPKMLCPKRVTLFAKLVIESFEDDLQDESFTRFLAKKLELRPYKQLEKL